VTARGFSPARRPSLAALDAVNLEPLKGAEMMDAVSLNALHFCFFPATRGTVIVPLATGDPAVLEALLRRLCAEWVPEPTDKLADRLASGVVCDCDRPFVSITPSFRPDALLYVVHTQDMVDHRPLALACASILQAAAQHWLETDGAIAELCTANRAPKGFRLHEALEALSAQSHLATRDFRPSLPHDN
jgi:hypothetical protein